MLEYIKHEPVVLMAVVEAVIVALVAFGVPITTEQKVAVAGLTAAVLTVLTRQLVTPVSKVSQYGKTG